MRHKSGQGCIHFTMNEQDDFQEILSLMPQRLQTPLKQALTQQPPVYEIRVRKNLPVVLCAVGRTCFLSQSGQAASPTGAVVLSEAEVDAVFAKLCHYSLYSYKESLNSGFISLQSGSRVGVCSHAVIKEAQVSAVKDISSLNFRLARAMPSCAEEVLHRLQALGMPSCIIIGAPCSGKTTLLRELCRRLSSGYGGQYRKCTIIDERGEIAAMHRGIARFDVGINTDVLSFFPKKEGILNAVRTLSPELIIADEIGSSAECAGILEGFNSGVKFLVSMHAADLGQAARKPQFNMLKQSGNFGAAICLGAKENLGKPMEFVTL